MIRVWLPGNTKRAEIGVPWRWLGDFIFDLRLGMKVVLFKMAVWVHVHGHRRSSLAVWST